MRVICQLLLIKKNEEMNETEYLGHIDNSIKEIEGIDFNDNWAYEKVIHSILKIQKLPIILFNEEKGGIYSGQE